MSGIEPGYRRRINRAIQRRCWRLFPFMRIGDPPQSYDGCASCTRGYTKCVREKCSPCDTGYPDECADSKRCAGCEG